MVHTARWDDELQTDGKKIAAICNLSSSSWVFDATGGNLTTADVAPDGFTVSNIQQLVPQAGGQGRPAYPSFSPDSRLLAWQHGTRVVVSAPDAAGAIYLTAFLGGAVATHYRIGSPLATHVVIARQ